MNTTTTIDPAAGDEEVLAAVAALAPLHPARVDLVAAAVAMPVASVRASLDRLVASGRCEGAPLTCANQWRPPPEVARELARRALEYQEQQHRQGRPLQPAEHARLLVAAHHLGSPGMPSPAWLAEQCARSDPGAAGGLHQLMAADQPDSALEHLCAAVRLFQHAGEQRRAVELFEAWPELGTVPGDDRDTALAAAALAWLHLGQLDRAAAALGPAGERRRRSQRVALVVRFFADPSLAPAALMEALGDTSQGATGALAVQSFIAVISGDRDRGQQLLDEAFVATRDPSVSEREMLTIAACSLSWLDGDLQGTADQAVDLLGSSSDLIRTLALFLSAACSMWQGDDQPGLDLIAELGKWPALDLVLGPMAVRALANSGRSDEADDLLRGLMAAARQAPAHPFSARVLATAFERDDGPLRAGLLAELDAVAAATGSPLAATMAGWARAIHEGSLPQLEATCRTARGAGLWLEATRALLAARGVALAGLEQSLVWAQLRLWADRQSALARTPLPGLGTPDVASLGPGDRQLAQLIAAGRSHEEIANLMYLSVGTVRVYASRLYRRLGVRRRDQLARLVGLDERYAPRVTPTVNTSVEGGR